jgi:GH15 family glucan-1,4-alpha-glucosidase
MALPIEDYAVLGDMDTAALVGRDGSIDWLCLPRFDSPACFASLIGTRDNGSWLLGPQGAAQTTRRYLGNSFVLETTHETLTGVVRITDFMPLGEGRADIIRKVEGIKGTVRLRHEWTVRFDYGKVRPWVMRRADSPEIGAGAVISAIAGPDMVVLRGSRLPHAVGTRHEDEFDISEGQRMTFTMTWFRSHHNAPAPLNVQEGVEQTVALWEDWAERGDYEGPYRAAVVRSLLVLRLLTDRETGGIVAAPTTSLPEQIGGPRNWDYRFCWLRDASLTLEALLSSGYQDETTLWRNWLLRAVAGDPEDMQIMYAVDGSRNLPEKVLSHLAGYEDSRPVRIGNEAVGQLQTDVMGEVMIALDLARQQGLEDSPESWALQLALLRNLCDHWEEPDNGLWEYRSQLRHFTHSRVMVWVAFDRAIKAVEQQWLQGPVQKWREIRTKVYDEVMASGYNKAKGSFTQHYDTTEVDASLLLLPTVGFLAADDPRFLGTVRAVERELLRDGLVLRYRTEAGLDGLPGDEHPFLACSFWLVTAYALTGRLDEGHALMARLVGLANDVGLLAEEYDPENNRMIGNFPQAFSHLALIGAANALRDADKALAESATHEETVTG